MYNKYGFFFYEVAHLYVSASIKNKKKACQYKTFKNVIIIHSTRKKKKKYENNTNNA